MEVSKQPVAVSINASSDDFLFYSSGAFSWATGSPVNHSMLLVGYMTQDSTPVWKLKNSFGIDWGVDGYMYLLRNDSTPDGDTGTCGIYTQVFYANQ
jgi:C1A family cysteine protease